MREAASACGSSGSCFGGFYCSSCSGFSVWRCFAVWAGWCGSACSGCCCSCCASSRKIQFLLLLLPRLLPRVLLRCLFLSLLLSISVVAPMPAERVARWKIRRPRLKAIQPGDWRLHAVPSGVWRGGGYDRVCGWGSECAADVYRRGARERMRMLPGMPFVGKAGQLLNKHDQRHGAEAGAGLCCQHCEVPAAWRIGRRSRSEANTCDRHF